MIPTVARRLQAPKRDLKECVCDNKDNPYWESTYFRDNAPPDKLNNRRHMLSSHVAPQIAWWLAFFPAERFLFVTSAELRDPARAHAVRPSSFASHQIPSL